MKISYDWLKNYINLDISPEKTGEILTHTGLEVEAIAKFETISGGLEGIVIGKILDCKKHPNADKLLLTQVDIGKGELSQIVCGAPNVDKGQKVLVATPGTTLYPKNGGAFKIKKTKIRGEISQGMICAEDEIGLGDSHEGIVVLDTDLPAGTPASEHYDLQTDHIFEIGLTPNRADAASHIGVARDLKAVLSKSITWPSVDDFKPDNQDLPVKVTVEEKEGNPRYSGVTISNLKIKESPQWLKNRLRSIGLSPINNIVDITNFVLHETGQPLHAFDVDAITGNEIIVKTLPEESTFTTLDEKDRKLLSTDLMICNRDEGMCIAGVFGGIKSGVKPTTEKIFLESAYFTPEYIRKTAQHHGLKTDASFRFERGTDPEITVYALKRAAMLIKDIAGGEISSDIVDVYPEKIEPKKVEIKYDNIDRLIGKKIDREDIHSILEKLDIIITEDSEQSFTVEVPPYRVDVSREADLVEEILRIYGYNNVELSEYLSTGYLSDFPEKDPQNIQYQISAFLSAKGFNEIITNSLTRPTYTLQLEELEPRDNVEIINKLSEDLGVLRQSMLFSGLEVLEYNLNRQQKDLWLFEFGKTFHKAEGKYLEKKHLCLFMTGNRQGESWLNKHKTLNFYDLSSIVQQIMHKCNCDEYKLMDCDNSIFDYGLEGRSREKNILHFGKVKSQFTNQFDIEEDVFYAEFAWEPLIEHIETSFAMKEIPKFPEVRRDLSLVIDREVTFRKIEELIERQHIKLLKSFNVFDVYEGKNIEDGKKAYALSFILQDKKSTLTDKVIDQNMEKLMSAFERDLDAVIRK